MATILLPVRGVNLSLGGLLAEMYQALSQVVMREARLWLNRRLEAEFSQELARDWHARRSGVNGSCRFQCQRCGTRWRRQFTRNGYRRGAEPGAGDGAGGAAAGGVCLRGECAP